MALIVPNGSIRVGVFDRKYYFFLMLRCLKNIFFIKNNGLEFVGNPLYLQISEDVLQAILNECVEVNAASVMPAPEGVQ